MSERLAVMQPYIFPYIGYFQLIYAVDTFVFYDDVNFIKQGFIQRNEIMANQKVQSFNFPCQGVSSFKKINEIELHLKKKNFKKFLRSIEQAYVKAPFFQEFYPVLHEFINGFAGNHIAQLNINSTKMVSNYLGLSTIFKISSIDYPQSKAYGREERLLDICEKENASIYINSINGRELYDVESFLKNGISLQFHSAKIKEYSQANEIFQPNLSIIDVIMNNSVDFIKDSLL